jgi:hypothetical protein
MVDDHHPNAWNRRRLRAFHYRKRGGRARVLSRFVRFGIVTVSMGHGI